MPLPSSGVLDFYTIRNYVYNSTHGWGNRTGAGVYAGPYPTYGTYDLGYYRNRWYSKSGVPSAQFPATTLSLDLFYGTSPFDEWNCACACDCA